MKINIPQIVTNKKNEKYQSIFERKKNYIILPHFFFHISQLNYPLNKQTFSLNANIKKKK